MKIDSRNTICPFCTLGCELGINYSMQRFWQTYPATGQINQGRLCPRGNIAARYLDYETRLCYPRKDNKDITWLTAMNEVRAVLKKCKTDEIAITFDKNLTLDEFRLIKGFAESLGTENFASSYLEPEYYFNYQMAGTKVATYDDLLNSELFFLIGDVFNQSPVIARFVLDSRYRRRENRIISLDSINTYTMAFADINLLCEPGTEPLVINAIISLLGKKAKPTKECSELSGVHLDKLESVAECFERLSNAVILNVSVAGKIKDPMLHALTPAVLANNSPGNKKYLPLAESTSFVGTRDFIEILPLIKARKIKVLINFGDYFPHFYPQLTKELSNLELVVATSTMKHEARDLPMIELPVPSNLEKDGEISTSFGKQRISQVAKPVSGAKYINEIIQSLGSQPVSKPETSEVSTNKRTVSLEEFADHNNRFLKRIRSQKKTSKTARLLAEKVAFDFMGLLNAPCLKIDPDYAKTLGIEGNGVVVVQSGSKSIAVSCKITNQVLHQDIAISAETPAIRSIFDFEFDLKNNICGLMPTQVKVWKKE